jgi:exonuclease III
MDNISVLCWNVRGLNDRARRDTVRTLIDDIRPAIVCLQETKLNVISEFVVFGMLGVNFREFAYLPASDTRGGILVAARQPDIAISDVHLGCFSITVRIRLLGQADHNSDWWLSCVYGPQEDNDKALFLEELEAIRDACHGPWAVCGDFNLILSEADKNNQRINRANLSRFRQTVTNLEL